MVVQITFMVVTIKNGYRQVVGSWSITDHHDINRHIIDWVYIWSVSLHRFYPAYKQIGNAVPPVFAWHIAKHINNFLNSNLNNE